MKPIEWSPPEEGSMIKSRHYYFDIGPFHFMARWYLVSDEYELIETLTKRTQYDKRDMDLLELICHIEFVKQELEPNGQ